MSFVKVTKSQRKKMYQEGGYRERSIMKNAKCVTNKAGRKDCVVFHDTKNERTATYRFGRGRVN